MDQINRRATARSDTAFPALSGRRASLRIPGPPDYDFIAQLELSAESLARYRHRGATPSPGGFEESLWRGVLAQFLVIDHRRRRASGLVSAFDVDFRNGHASIALIAVPDRMDRLTVAEGFQLFVDYLFVVFGLRKLYGEVLDFNFDQFASQVPKIAVEEGRLLGHELHDGRPVDVRILAIHRQRWQETRRESRLDGDYESLMTDPVDTAAIISRSRAPADFGSFKAWLANEVSLGPEFFASGADAGLSELDSLALLEIWTLLDDLAPHGIPDEAFQSLRTLGELHEVAVMYLMQTEE